jgi:hypothetical protein
VRSAFLMSHWCRCSRREMSVEIGCRLGRPALPNDEAQTPRCDDQKGKSSRKVSASSGLSVAPGSAPSRIGARRWGATTRDTPADAQNSDNGRMFRAGSRTAQPPADAAQRCESREDLSPTLHMLMR